jgi:outer membrane receptor for ferric coprogen and ferric-rhodotorulic acid
MQERSSRHACVAHALRPTVLAAAACFMALAPVAARAQASVAESSALHLYDIPAQPLGATLTRIAEESGERISLDAQTVRGIDAPAVRGRYSAEQAAQQALAGSGLRLMRTGSGAWTVQRDGSQRGAGESEAAAASPATLPTITISGKAPGSTSEGSGAYTTGSSSSSTRLNLSAQETPQSLTVVTRQRLDDQRSNSLSDVLDTVSGITVTRDGLGAESDGFWSRGFEIQNYEIDGVPTASLLNHYAENMAMYDRVEIVRGATGLISGLGNPSATINLIPKRPTARPEASVSAEAGSWNRAGFGVDASGELGEAGALRGRIVADYRRQDAWIDRYEQRTGLLYGIVEADLDADTLLTLGFSHQRIDVDSPMRSGLPALYPDGGATHLPRSTSASPSWSYNDHEQSTAFVSLERQFANGWNGKLEYGFSRDSYDSVYTYLNGTLERDGSGTSLLPTRFKGKPRQHNLDAYLTGPFSLFGRRHELIGGLTLSRLNDDGPSYGGWQYDYASSAAGSIPDLFSYDGDNASPTFSVSGSTRNKTTNHAAYLTGRFDLAQGLKLIVGGRAIRWSRDIVSVDAAGVETPDRDDRKVFVPYVGTVYDLTPQWAAYASVTKIFNPQSYGVRDENNDTLDPMEGRGVEVGLKGRHLDGRLESSLALFDLQQDNLAVWQAEYPGSNVYKAEQNTSSKGVEAQANGELAPGWQLAAGYAYTLTEDADGHRINTVLPKHSVRVFSSYRLPGAFAGLTLGAGVNWQSKVGSAGVEQGSYALFSLLARYEFDRHWSAALNVHNLLDRRYYSYAGYYSFYGAPRNAVASLKYTF